MPKAVSKSKNTQEPKKSKKIKKPGFSLAKAKIAFAKLNKSLIVVTIASLAVGLGIGYLVWGGKSSAPDASSVASKMSTNTKDSTTSKQERLERSLERVQSKIEADTKSGKITEEQAKKLSDKVKEVYDYLKNNYANEDKKAARDELSKKRQEWRDWAKQNDVSSTYIITLN